MKTVPKRWLMKIAATLAIGTICCMAGCNEAAQPDADIVVGDAGYDVPDSEEPVENAVLTLDHGVLMAGGTPMMSDRFELVGYVSVSAQRASSARFTLEGGF